MIPAPLYELLPYGYALTGMLAVAGLETIFGKVCGALLIIAGVVIYLARMRYRHRKIRPEDVASAKAHNDSRRQTETSRRNVADPNSQARVNPEQDFEKGAASEESGNYQEAFKWYLKAANQGYAPAQVNLGALYAEGHGVPQDFQEALAWYHKAAGQGYALAQFNLGVMCIAGQGGISKDHMMAYVWFSRAAMQGDEDARQAQKKIAAKLTADQKARAQLLLV
ncbi:MAG: sel1 repeat family protein [Candidatus Competibacter sp.]|nr:sel1 repeat family protein [Candidatus Competibacter sp.]MDG4606316.1 tetratricopeptide repeat protein [Candidatus Contendobacter sp.]HRD49157.1 tetratricopeptide repeat protein [Candidatus Contendobacter sp.]